MNLTQIPERLIRGSFEAARLPLILIGSKVSKNGVDTWPPIKVLDTVEAVTKKTAGLVLRDQSLKDQGSALQERSQKLREAEALDAVAEQRKQLADERMNDTLAENEAKRDQAKQQNAQIKDKAAQEAGQKVAQVASKAHKAEEQAVDLRDQAEAEMDVEATVAELAAVGAKMRAEQTEAQLIAEERKAARKTKALKQV